MAITKDDWEGLIENAAGKLTFQETKEALENAFRRKKYNIVHELEELNSKWREDEITDPEEYIIAIKKIVNND